MIRFREQSSFKNEMCLFRMTTSFGKVSNSVKNTFHTLDCIGAAIVLFHNNELQVEQYWGKQSNKKNARSIQADTKFHLASCRKSYMAFAI